MHIYLKKIPAKFCPSPIWNLGALCILKNDDRHSMLFVVCIVGKLLYSSSTWWVIVAQYKDFKKSQKSRPLLTTVLQTATFAYWDTVPSLYIITFK